MRAILLTLILVQSLCAPLRAGSFDDANRAYAENRFTASIEGYQDILKREGWSASVLFNLANAQLHDGKTAPAILNYERAQWLAPGDPDVAANLNLALKQAGLPPAVNSWLDVFTHTFSANAWSWLASGSFLILCLSILLHRARPAHRPLAWALIGAGTLGLLSSAIALWGDTGQLHRAVIVKPESAALISPFANSKSAFPLTTGEIVHVEKTYGDFFFIKGHDGRTGWVEKSSLEHVIPPSS